MLRSSPRTSITPPRSRRVGSFMRDDEIRIVAIIGTVVATAIVAVPVIVFAGVGSGDKAAYKAPLDNMIQIEATLAYKSPKAPKQPQKVKQEAPPEVKPEGV